MKSIYLLALLTIFATSGCKEKEKKEIVRLTQENTELRRQSQAKDSSINDILQSFNEIESNLAVIKQKESVISSTSNKEMSPDVKTRINDDIKVINDLMGKNKREVSRLHQLLKASNLKIEEVQRIMADLNQRVAQRDSQINVMKTDLASLNFSIESLNASMDTLKTQKSALASTVEDRTTKLNTAYYVIGTKKKLLTDNIVSKTGGIIGISSSIKLRPDFNDQKFEKVDIRQLSEIPINSKKPQLVTTHPAGTYELVKNSSGMVEDLKILNPEKFWSTSKYLVVMLN
jgi:DNA repair exonuclease SbcCD ATPase subunit